MRKIAIEDSVETYTDDNAGLMATLASTESFAFEREANTFGEYTKNVRRRFLRIRLFLLM
jgi:hypothetical protein